MIKATKITEKSWLLSKRRTRCGLLRKDGDAYIIMGGPHSGKYENLTILEEKIEKFEFVEPVIKENKEPIFLEGYPVKVDEAFDINNEKGYPTYTKKEGSADVYAAGYWCIDFNGNWHGHYCPRAKTLVENNNIGPLKTKLEMDHSLRVENGK